MSEWKVMPLYGIAKPKQIVNCVDRELLSVYLGKGVVPFSSQSAKRTNVTSLDLSKYQAVDCGDFVLNNQQAWRGSVGVSKYTGIVSPAYIVLSLSDAISTDYANYLFQSRSMVDKYVVCSKGVGSIQRNIYWDYLKRVSFPLPPRPEQDQIVRYLDWKVSQINKLISNMRRQIVLQQEQLELYLFSVDGSKTQLGYWKSCFPCEWELKSGKRLFSEIIDKGHTDKELIAVTQNDGAIYKKDCLANYVSPSGDFSTQKLVSPCDFIISLRSFQGGVEVSFIEGLVSPAYTIFRLNKQNDLLFTYYRHLLKSRAFITLMNTQITDIRDGKKIGFRGIREFDFPIPPEEHLRRIADLSKKIDNLKIIVKQKTAFLHEYRTRLISDVVTGKINVHEVAVPEYETVEDVSTADDTQDEDEPIDTEDE